MKQGKFDVGRRSAAVEPREQLPEEGKHRPDWLLILVPILVLGALAAILLLGRARREAEAATEPEGLTKTEAMELYRRMAEQMEQTDMVLTLLPDDPNAGEEPITVTLSPAQSRVRVDLTGLEADLEEGVGKLSRRRYAVDPNRYISLDRGALRAVAERTAALYDRSFVASFATLETRSHGQTESHELVVNLGRTGRSISAEAIYQKLLEAYRSGELTPELVYAVRKPAELDLDAIHEQYCTEPINAELDEKTFAISPDVPGYGYAPEELEQLLERTEEGQACVLPLHAIRPERTAADVEAALYADTLAEAHTPHSWVDDRTVNLILACEAINGTVVMPGETFSFNEVVGERTAEKGYREATIYGAGGATVPELGGGVCQVASSIYYAVLQADLETVERYCHMYLVTYVPQGMDAAIYWGRLDYKFKNNSPYPVRIETSVSDGQVHVYLRGTEWKQYSVRLSSEVLEEFPYETKEQYVYDGSYAPGEVIVTPYTGYRVITYRTVVDRDGNAGEPTRIAASLYNKRDKVVAVAPPVAAPTAPAPTESDSPAEP